jgi:hypothetical protein
VGLFGNTLSVIVFYKCKRKDAGTIQYLSALAVVDSFNLIFTALRDWLDYGIYIISQGDISVDIFMYSSAACKAGRFSGYGFQALSAWILVAFSLERCFAILAPLKRAANMSRGLRFRILIGLVIAAVICTLPTAVTVDVFYEKVDRKTCYFDPALVTQYGTVVMTFVSLLIRNAIPCLFIMIANVILASGIMKSIRKHRRITRNESAFTVNEIGIREMKCLSNLLAITVLYVITMGPQVIVWVYFNGMNLYYFDEGYIPGVNLKLLFQIGKLTTLLTPVNYSFNFLIYNISLDFYRQKVQELLCWSGKRRGTDQGAGK